MTDFDPQAPLIGSDGLEYACFADKILGRPLGTWRNERVKDLRACSTPEEDVRRWIELYDGDDPRTTGEIDATRQARRQVRNAFAF